MVIKKPTQTSGKCSRSPEVIHRIPQQPKPKLTSTVVIPKARRPSQSPPRRKARQAKSPTKHTKESARSSDKRHSPSPYRGRRHQSASPDRSRHQESLPSPQRHRHHVTASPRRSSHHAQSPSRSLWSPPYTLHDHISRRYPITPKLLGTEGLTYHGGLPAVSTSERSVPHSF